jgi:hypothetical protein
MYPCPQPHMHTGWREQGGNFNFLSKLLSPINVHVLKIGTLVWIVTLARMLQDSPFLRFCYRFNKEIFLFFCVYKGLLPWN